MKTYSSVTMYTEWQHQCPYGLKIQGRSFKHSSEQEREVWFQGIFLEAGKQNCSLHPVLDGDDDLIALQQKNS